MGQSVLTLNNLLQNTLDTNQKKIALHFGDKSMTYEELRVSANQVAHALQSLGVGRNTRVALFMSNTEEYVVSELAIYLAGGTKIALNSMLTELDVSFILKDSKSEILIVEEKFFSIINHIVDQLPDLKTVVLVGAERDYGSNYVLWDDFIRNQPKDNVEVHSHPKDQSFILYTGGTTGNPKGVVHNRETTSLTFLSQMIETNMQHDEKILLTTPLPHAAGLYLYAGLLKGAEIFIEDKFDPQTMLEKIEQHKITFLSLVPTTLYRLLDYMEEKIYDVSSIRTIQYGTAPITLTRLTQAIDIFGHVFLQAYGLTETQSVVSWLRKNDHKKGKDQPSLLKSCGRPSMFSRIKIVDENRDEVQPGIEGEIVVHCLTNMIEYLGLPEKTSDTLTDGWVFTGDLGVIDENGYLYVLDRKKDMIISGGMNVYSTEVENVIQKHPSVRQVAVIGIPDDDWGEAVNAFVILKEDTALTELKEYCKRFLSKYKVPKAIHIVESFPLTTYGKIDKKTLRSPFWKQKERQI
ncbi:AMP-binding protein [Mesobacillus maritimus]|uniref:AMP-binding protein n=1 Tax=Mesobacillus maritimus TaxID=1643336 RepID=UPI00384A6AF5